MQKSVAATATFDRGHRGWTVVAVTFLAALVSSGLLGMSGILTLPLQSQFGWSVAEMSPAFGIRLFLFGAMAPFAALFMERYGVRQVVLVAGMIILVGLSGMLIMTSAALLFVVWGLATGIGMGFIGQILNAYVATRWFRERQGVVMGILTAGSAAANLFVMPILFQLTQNAGWRTTMLALASAVMLLMILVLRLVREKKDLDAGETASVYAMPAPDYQLLPFKSLVGAPFRILRAAALVPMFWLLAATFALSGASTIGLFQTYFIPLASSFGFAPTMAAGMLAAMGLFELVGVLAAGFLTDRFDSRRLLAWSFGLRGTALLLLPIAGLSVLGLTGILIVTGLVWMAAVPPMLKLTTEYFGRSGPVVFGWMLVTHQLAAFLAAFAGDVISSYFQSYLPVFIGMGVLCIVAALAFVMARRRANDANTAVFTAVAGAR